VREPGARQLKRAWQTVLLAGAMSCAFVGFAVYLVWFAPLGFDRAGWDAGGVDARDSRHRRHRMADSLVASHTLQGKTRAQIIELLGAPEASGISTWDMSYLLGDERGFISIDGEWLVLRFDPAGRVNQAAVVTD
jgi:hypothetical protein